MWPIFVIVDGNISIQEESDFIDGDGSYINTGWEYQEFSG